MKRTYRLRADREDNRDHVYSFSAPSGLPPKIDLRPQCSPVFDQGDVGSCFTGDTEVSLLDGTSKSLEALYKEAKEVWVFAVDENGSFVPAKAIAKLTGFGKELIQLTLDNNETIKCTPDHKFMLRDGSYKEAQDLTPDDSLMPLNFRIQDAYLQYFDNKSSYKGKKRGWKFVHTRVNSIVHSEYKLEVQNRIETQSDKYLVTHHKDFNKFNNIPENLEWMGNNEHSNFHHTHWNGTPAQKEHARKQAIKLYSERPGWNSGAASKGGKQAWQNAQNDPQRLANIQNCLDIGRYDPEVKKRAAFAISLVWKNKSFEEKAKHGKNRRLAYENSSQEVKDLYRKRAQDSKLGGNRIRERILKTANRILKEYGFIFEDLWSHHKCPKINISWAKVLTYFSLETLISKASNYNHFVTKIEKVQEKQDVYCLEVAQYHNFRLKAGVIVHNCTGNALAGAWEFLELKELRAKTSGTEEFDPTQFLAASRLFIYYNERQLEGTTDEDSGGTLRDGIKSLARWGCCEEKTWPYIESQYMTKPSDQAYTEAALHQITQYQSIASLAALKQWLATGIPAVGGIEVFSGLESQEVADTGLLQMPTEDEEDLGGHAICFVGYNDQIQQLIVRNSWGEAWGQAGYFLMPYPYYLAYASDVWGITK